MTRKINTIINSDREIIDLRIDAEDLINNMESLTEDEYNKMAQDIKTKIDARISFLIDQNK